MTSHIRRWRARAVLAPVLAVLAVLGTTAALTAGGTVVSGAVESNSPTWGLALRAGGSLVSCGSDTDCVVISRTGAARLTVDGGLQWSKASKPSDLGAGDGEISCATGKVCEGTEVNGIVRTTNGGKTWTNQYPIKAGFGDGPDTTGEVDCASKSVCFASLMYLGIGNYPNDYFVIRTTDGGDQWSIDAGPTGGPMACPSKTVCYGFDGQGALLRTADAGESWTTISTLPDDALSMSCGSPETCVAFGLTSPSTTTPVLRTTDGGRSWSETQLKASLESVSCATSTMCMVVGEGRAGRPVAYLTADGGTKWKGTTLSSTAGGLYGVSCHSPTFCVATGRTGSGFTQKPVTYVYRPAVS